MLLFSCSVIICIITAFKHEMWGDEAQAFLIARDSHSFIDLFNNVRYEGHPYLWYLIIKLSIYFIPHFYVIQVLNVVFATAIFTVIYFFSPFSALQKFLIASSYFISFEWVVVSRSYALGVFLLLLAVALHERLNQDNKFIFIAVALGLAINSSAHAMIVAVLLAAYIFLYTVKTKSSFRRLFRGKKLAGICIICISLALYFIQTFPPADRLGEEKIHHWNAPATDKIAYSLKNLTKGFFFIQRTVQDQAIWQNDMVVNKYSSGAMHGGRSVSDIFYLVAGLSVFLLTSFFLKQKEALLFYIGTTVVLFIGNYGSPYGLSLRHCGFYFLTLIMAFWLNKGSVAASSKLNIILGGVLILQFFSSVIIHIAEWKLPFSNAKMTAKYLKDNHLDTLKVLGHFWQTSPVIAYTGTKKYVLIESGTETSFIKLDTIQHNKNLNANLHPERFMEVAKKTGAEILLLLPADTIPIPESMGYKRLVTFDKPAIQFYEKYVIYQKMP